jgi:hypothetical protein
MLQKIQLNFYKINLLLSAKHFLLKKMFSGQQ